MAAAQVLLHPLTMAPNHLDVFQSFKSRLAPICVGRGVSFSPDTLMLVDEDSSDRMGALRMSYLGASPGTPTSAGRRTTVIFSISSSDESHCQHALRSKRAGLLGSTCGTPKATLNEHPTASSLAVPAVRFTTIAEPRSQPTATPMPTLRRGILGCQAGTPRRTRNGMSESYLGFDRPAVDNCSLRVSFCDEVSVLGLFCQGELIEHEEELRMRVQRTLVLGASCGSPRPRSSHYIATTGGLCMANHTGADRISSLDIEQGAVTASATTQALESHASV